MDEGTPHSAFRSSLFNSESLQLLRERGAFSSDFTVIVPQPSHRPEHPPAETLAFWSYQVNAGLRFPIPAYLDSLSKLYKIPLNQFTPMAIRMMISFYVLLGINKAVLSAELFYSQYAVKWGRDKDFYYVSIRPKGISRFLGRLFSMDKGWKEDYFFIKPTQENQNFPLHRWCNQKPDFSSPTAHIAACSSLNTRVILALNRYVKQHGLYDLSKIVTNPEILYEFNFSSVRPTPDQIAMSGNWRETLTLPAGALERLAIPKKIPSKGEKRSSAGSEGSSKKQNSDSSDADEIAMIGEWRETLTLPAGALESLALPKKLRSKGVNRSSAESEGSSKKRKLDSSNTKTFSLPESLLRLNKLDKVKFWEELLLPADQDMISKFGHEERKAHTLGNLTDLMVLVTSLFGDLARAPRDISVLNALVKAKDEENAQLRCEIHSLKADSSYSENAELHKQVSDLNHEIESLKAQLEEANHRDTSISDMLKAKDEESIELHEKNSDLNHQIYYWKAQLAKASEMLKAKDEVIDQVRKKNWDLRDEINSLKAKLADGCLDLAKAREEGKEVGRRELMHTVAGQAFLESMHNDLLEAYHNSTEYLANLREIIPECFVYGFKSAADQFCKEDFDGNYDLQGPLSAIPAPRSFKGDPTLPVSYPWWLPSIRKNVENLCGAPKSMFVPAPKQTYDLVTPLEQLLP